MDATHAAMTILHFIHQLISCNVCMAWSNISSTSKWSLISYAKKKGTSTSPQKRNIFNSPNALTKNMRSPCEASSISSARFQRSTFWCNKQSEKISQPLSSFTGFLKDLARDLLKSLSGWGNWLFCSRSHMKLRARSFVIMNHIRLTMHQRLCMALVISRIQLSLISPRLLGPSRPGSFWRGDNPPDALLTSTSVGVYLEDSLKSMERWALLTLQPL